MKFRDLSSGTGTNFLKMNSGESVRGVLRGEVVDFRSHWDGRTALCLGREKCDLCKKGEKSSFRFRINLIVQENGAYVAKTFENGKAVYEALKALHGDYDLEKHWIKITRHGTGTDTTYAIVPVPNGAVTAAQEAQFKQVRLNELTPTSSPLEEEEN